MNERQTELLASVLDGTASADDRAELLARLRADPALADEFIRHRRLECELEFLFTESAESDKLARERIMLFLTESASTEFPLKVRRTMEQMLRERESRGRRRVRFALPLAAAAATLLAVGGAWWGLTGAMRGRRNAELGAGVARVTEASGGMSGLKVGSDIRVNTKIRTGRGERVRFQYVGEQTFVDLTDQTEMTLCARDPAAPKLKKLELRSGRLAVQVAKQTGLAGLVVMTPHARAEVKGTRFALHAGKDFTRLDVMEGLVALTCLPDGGSVEVQSGRFAIAGKDYALRSYPANAEYVESAILFQDDFESGLGNWEIVQRGPDGQNFVAAGEEGRKCALSATMAGLNEQSVTKSLCVEIPKTAAFEIGMQNKNPITATAYSAELDVRFGAVGSTFDITLPGCAEARVLSLRKPSVGAGWHHWRAERAPASDPEKPGLYDVKQYINGRLYRHVAAKFDARWLVLAVPKGRVAFDNVVIRELVPAEDARGEQKE